MNRKKNISVFCLLSFVILTTAMAGGSEKNDLKAVQGYIHTGAYADAVRLLIQKQKVAPDDPETAFLLGVCFLNLGRLSEAHEAFTIATQQSMVDQGRIAKAYMDVGLRELEADNIRTARILLQKAARQEPSLKKSIGNRAFQEGRRLFNSGQYEAADERFAVANTFDDAYGREVCDMFFDLGHSADGKASLLFYRISSWYCSDHNEEIGLRLLRLAKGRSTPDWQEMFKQEAVKYVGEEAVRAVFPDPSWKTIHASIYFGKGYDDTDNPEFHVRTVQFGKQALPGDKIVVETEGRLKFWDAGWEECETHCVILPKDKTPGEYLYVEAPRDQKITVKIQRYE